MSRLFYHTMQDNLGNLLFDVSGTMRIAGSGTLATIYGDEGLSVILPNPMTNHPSFGSFKCFLGVGDYDFYMAKAGYTFETLTGVQGHGSMAQQDASAVAITGGTIVGAAISGGTVSGLGSLDVGGAATLNNTLDVVGTTRLQAAVGIGVVPGAPYALHVNPGQVYLEGTLGVGVVPSPATAAVMTPSLLVTVLTCNGTAAKPGGGAWSDSSSATLKGEIADIQGALGLLLAQRGRVFEWTEPTRQALLPGKRYGLIAEEVTLLQWHEGDDRIAAQGFEALVIEALREVVQRLDALDARLAAREDTVGG